MFPKNIAFVFALLYVANVCHAAELHMFQNERCEGEFSIVDINQGNKGTGCATVAIHFNVHQNDTGITLTEYDDSLCNHTVKELALKLDECVRLAENLSVKPAAIGNSANSVYANVGVFALIALISLGVAAF